MLYKCDSDIELEAVVITVRDDTGIADVWLNKNIDTYTEAAENPTDNPITKYTSDQAYFQHTAHDKLKDDLLKDFDKWFDYAAEWQPTAGDVSQTAKKLAEVTNRVDMLEECLMEMSEVVYE